MTDHLIEKYDAVVLAARQEMEATVGEATGKMLEDKAKAVALCAEVCEGAQSVYKQSVEAAVGEWGVKCGQAAMELSVAMEERNASYMFGVGKAIASGGGGGVTSITGLGWGDGKDERKVWGGDDAALIEPKPGVREEFDRRVEEARKVLRNSGEDTTRGEIENQVNDGKDRPGTERGNTEREA